MKRKPYITTSVFVGVLIAIGAVAYHYYPDAIKNIMGGAVVADNVTEIDAEQSNATSDGEIMPPDDGSPSSEPVRSGTKSIATENDDAARANTGTHFENNPSTAATSTPSMYPGNSDIAPVVTATDTASETSSLQTAISSPSCSFPSSAPSTTQQIILNEIAWMGSPSSSDAEWMEIKNSSASVVDLSGWELLNASGKINILFSEGDDIQAGGFFLLSRGSVAAVASSSADMTAPPGEKIYSGTLANAGDILALMDPQCATSDYLDASEGWSGGNNATKQTLERNANGGGWHTSASPGGTPGAENSAGPPPTQYSLTIAFEGSGPDSVVSTPPGLVCAASCTGSYASGTEITVTPEPGKNSTFGEWSGLCYGETTCSFVIAGNTSITADFRSALPESSSTDSDSSVIQPGATGGPTPTTTSTTPTPAQSVTSTSTSDATTSTIPAASSDTIPNSPGNVLISAVQIAGASSSNDLVKLYNPTAASIVMSGWKLHKKSATGADYSLRDIPTGAVIGAGQSFIWANSEGGFSGTISADVSSTETLSADNSVALIDANGTIVDAVAWGTGTGQYGEGSPYPSDPVAGQVLVRQSVGGVFVNTENNAHDFTLE